MTEHVIAEATDWENGERRVVTIDDVEIVVLRLDDGFYAYRNTCLHQGGSLEEGTLTGTWETSFDEETLQEERKWIKEGEILSCPWHGWEYDARTGDCLSQLDYGLPAYEVETEDGSVVLSLDD